MRVKKPTSKRRTTRMTEGIKKKVNAHHRKQRKLAKKDITWKSKHKKDPGIPNSFPYKEQILAEIEEQRRKDEEQKELRRQQQREAAKQAGASEEQIHEMEQQEEQMENSNRLAALVESAQAAAKEYDDESSEEEDDEMMMDDEEVDEDSDDDEEDEGTTRESSRKAFDKFYKQVVKQSDVVLYVLDARNPEGTRSREVERLVLADPSKRLMFVLNKIDLVSTDVLKRWINHLKLSFPTLPLAASSASSNAITFNHKTLTNITTSKALLEALKTYASSAKLKRAVSVGVIGYPNVGKSSVINSLLARHGGGKTSSCPTGAQAGVTTAIRKVKIDNKLAIYDTPGIVFPSNDDGAVSTARLVLLNALPPRQIEDPRGAVSLLLKRLSKNKEHLAKLYEVYDIPPIVDSPHDRYVTEFLLHVARRKGRMGKRGIPDLESAATAVVTDWRDGRIVGWAEPPKVESSSNSKKELKDEDKTQIVQEWAEEFSLDGLLDF